MSTSETSSTLSWYNPGYPGFPQLNATNALYYFCNLTNPFYNSQSLNQQLLSQGIGFEMLNTFNVGGVLYQLSTHYESKLFLIVEYKRSPEENIPDEPISIYYILDGIVYQAPVLFDVIDSRLQNCMTELEKTLVEMQECMKYSVNGIRMWQFPGDDTKVKLQRELLRDEYTIRERSFYPIKIQEHVVSLIEQLEHESYVDIKEMQGIEAVSERK